MRRSISVFEYLRRQSAPRSDEPVTHGLELGRGGSRLDLPLRLTRLLSSSNLER